jgi:hypothetical protein
MAKKWSYLEIGGLAYGIRSSAGAIFGGIAFLIMGSFMSSAQSSDSQQFGQSNGPNIGSIVQTFGVLFLIAGIIGAFLCYGYYSRRQNETGGDSSSDAATASHEVSIDGRPLVHDVGDNRTEDGGSLSHEIFGAIAAENAAASSRRRRFGIGFGGPVGRPPGFP